MDRALSDEALDGAVSEIAAALGASHASATPPRVAEAVAEAVPVLEALLAATQPGRTHTDRHEALALAALLGRRAAALALSPTLALTLTSAIVTVARARGSALDADLEVALRACVVEGLVAGEGERVRAEVDARTAECVRPFPLAERVLGVTIFASVGPDALESALDAVARKLLETDAQSCVASVHGEPPERDARAFVSALASLGAAASMVGVRVAFAVESPSLRAALPLAVPAHTVAASLLDALEAVGLGIARRDKPLARLKGFFGGR